MNLPDTSVVLHVAAIGLILIGIAGIVMSRHLLRIIFGLALLEAGANLFLLLASYRQDAAAPVIVDGVIPPAMADPVPQALVLTAIVIGVGILALALGLALMVQRAYGTLDMRQLQRSLEQDMAVAAGTDLPASRGAPAPLSAAATSEDAGS